MARLLDNYRTTVVPTLQEKLGRRNVLSLPRVEKIVVSMGLGKSRDEPKRVEAAAKDLATITGQKPVLTKARRSIANFQLREGNVCGAMVTLRGKRMYEFLDRLINLAIPRIRDFRGLDPSAFDGRGNYSMGIGEQLVFHEIKVDDVQVVQGMDITICTTAKTDEEALELLTLFGVPFRKG